MIIPTTNMVVNANTPALLAIGGNTATGNTFGVAININLPSGGTNAEYLRMNANGVWKASLALGNAYYSGSICAGATNSGGNCQVQMNDSGGASVGVRGDAGRIGFSSGSIVANTFDTAISRDSAGVIDFGTGAQGSTAGSWKATNGTLSGTFTLTGGAITTGGKVCTINTTTSVWACV